MTVSFFATQRTTIILLLLLLLKVHLALNNVHFIVENGTTHTDIEVNSHNFPNLVLLTYKKDKAL